jgi:hypothetical protein
VQPTQKEGECMKILQVKDGKGWYSIDGNNFEQIDKISKTDLLELLEKTLKEDVDLDPLDVSGLPNQAHLIIYKSIYEKLSQLVVDKNRFKDESDRLFLQEIMKYSK